MFSIMIVPILGILYFSPETQVLSQLMTLYDGFIRKRISDIDINGEKTDLTKSSG